jgi:hypothetical protein
MLPALSGLSSYPLYVQAHDEAHTRCAKEAQQQIEDVHASRELRTYDDPANYHKDRRCDRASDRKAEQVSNPDVLPKELVEPGDAKYDRLRDHCERQSRPQHLGFARRDMKLESQQI